MSDQGRAQPALVWPRKLVALAVVATAAIAALLGTPPALAAPGTTPPRDIAGVALHPWRVDRQDYTPYWPLRDPALRESTFAKLHAAGVRHARVDMRWSVIDKDGYGRLGLYDWGEFDGIAESAEKHGVSLLPMVAFTPGWANGNGGTWKYPDNPDDFENFLVAAFQRYPQVPAWEIWNEPNHAYFSRPGIDPGKFVGLLRAAHRARARVGSSAKLISGGLASGGHVSVPVFFAEMARLGAFNYVDGFGIHPYSYVTPEDLRSEMLKLPALRDRLVQLGKPNVGIWVTEMGSANSTRASGYGPSMGEAEQARRLGTASALAAGWSWLRNLTWYEFRESCSDAADPECRLGLVREDLSEKQGWTALKRVVAGILPKLGTRTSLKLKAVRLPAPKRSTPRRAKQLPPQAPPLRIDVSGSVVTPGSTPSPGAVVITLQHATTAKGPYRSARTVTIPVTGSAYRASLGPLGSGLFRVTTRYVGTARYTPSSSPTGAVANLPPKPPAPPKRKPRR